MVIVDGDKVLLEKGLWEAAGTVAELGLEPVPTSAVTPFGGGQAILRSRDGLLGGSDRRKDGYAGGL